MTQKRISRKPKQQSQTRNFRVSITHDLVAPSPEAAKSVKARISKKVGTAAFSSIKRTQGGYKFSVRTSYVRKLPSHIPVSVVANHVRQKDPHAKVTVSRQ